MRQINADESAGFEYSHYKYNTTLLYQAQPVRAADHNPKWVGLAAPHSQQALSVSVTANRTRIQKTKETSAVPEAVTGGQGVTPNGSGGFWVDGQQVGTVPLAADGMASKVVGPFASVGTRTVGVPYYGDIVTTARTGTTTM